MNTIVKTNYGQVEGFMEGNLIKWFGIPFAKAPVGDLRFKRPVKPEAWDGVLETKAFKPKPIQYMPEIPGAVPTPYPESEDCLYLNVWAPEDALSGDKKYPVYIYIYGGANSGGEASDPQWDGTAMASEGLVYVTITYRVGPLGFYPFYLYDKSFDSNCGVADQIEGVRWVKENIAAFGGDDNNITIAGESAGGTAVMDLLTAPSARGLFNKAIVESALPDSAAENESMAIKNLDLFLDKMGLSKDEVYKIKEMPAEKLKEAAIWVATANTRTYPGIFVPGPVIDDLIPEKPWEAMAKGSAKGVDVIFGTNHDEGILFTSMKMFPYNWEEIDKMLDDNGYGAKKEAFRAVYNAPVEPAIAADIATDRGFWVDYVRCADAQSGHGKVYAYRYDYSYGVYKNMHMGAVHASEIVLGLATPIPPMVLMDTPPAEVAAVSKVIHNSFVNFAKTGDPNGAHLPFAWEQYKADDRKTFIINTECSVETNPNSERFELWKDIQLFK